LFARRSPKRIAQAKKAGSANAGGSNVGALAAGKALAVIREFTFSMVSVAKMEAMQKQALVHIPRNKARQSDSKMPLIPVTTVPVIPIQKNHP